MTCEENDLLIHGYIDGELDVTKSVEVEKHIAECKRCAGLQDNYLMFRNIIQTPDFYYRSPRLLHKHIRNALRKESRLQLIPSGRIWRVPIFAAALIIIAFIVWKGGMFFAGTAGSKEIAGELLNGHIRSLLADHITDVPSTDQHTVKPWFNGKIDYSPVVKNLDAQGFILIGGRLDYIGQRTVSVVVYKNHQHIINLFSWPSRADENIAPDIISRQGYHLLNWQFIGMTYWAVSDVNEEDLETFKQLTSR